MQHQQAPAWFIRAVCDDLATKGTLLGDTYFLHAALVRNPGKVSRGLQTLANWQRSTIWLRIPGSCPGSYISHTRFVPQHCAPQAPPEVDLTVDPALGLRDSHVAVRGAQ